MNYNDFENEIYGNSNNEVMTYEEMEKVAASKVRGSILWMVFGLVITGMTGFFFVSSLYSEIIPYQILGIIFPVAMVIELVTVFAFTALTFKANTMTLRLMFLFYSALNGVTLSVLMLIYDIPSILYAFLGTIILFVVLAIYGYVTREDLSKYGSILKAGLIALIIMGVINIFLKSNSLMWISSILGVMIFIVFIAYDINRIKNYAMAYAVEEDMTILDRLEIHGALNLYLDFINLFIYILRIIGRRR